MGNAKGTRFAIIGTPANLLNSPTSASCDLGARLIKLKVSFRRAVWIFIISRSRQLADSSQIITQKNSPNPSAITV